MTDDKTIHPISIIGLPGSGKTTFLAALWHLVRSRDLEGRLKLDSLRQGNYEHLMDIEARWLSAKEQERTQVAGMRTVSMDLLNFQKRPVRVTFPDVPGEDYQYMWEQRAIDNDLARTLSSGNIMLLLNGNKIEAPNWVYDETELCRKLNLPLPNGEAVAWHPCLAPTQVQLVDLLQNLHRPPLDCGPRRLAVMVSVWDKASGEGKMPELFLAEKLSLLDQYLRSCRDEWTWRVYGVSAQGGDYDSTNEGAVPNAQAAALREKDVPSERIRLVYGDNESHDLTEPLEWLMN
jgi:hypothetical protein